MENTFITLDPPEVYKLGDETETLYARTWRASNPAEKKYPPRQVVYAKTAEAAAAEFKTRFPRVRAVTIGEYCKRDDRPQGGFSARSAFGGMTPYTDARYSNLPNDGGASLAIIPAGAKRYNATA